MNERIRELVKQSGGHFSTHNLMSNPVQQRESVELWDDKIEKFAELIVKECADYITEYYPHSRYEAFYMKRHFGVKE